MTRETAVKYAAEIAALQAGKVIQMNWKNPKGNDIIGWCDSENPEFCDSTWDYRIKPEPKRIWVVVYADGMRATACSMEQARSWISESNGAIIEEYAQVLP